MAKRELGSPVLPDGCHRGRCGVVYQGLRALTVSGRADWAHNEMCRECIRHRREHLLVERRAPVKIKREDRRSIPRERKKGKSSRY